jgi:hypothetical protein
MNASRAAIVSVLTSACLAAVALAQPAAPTFEYQVKAAFLLNFLRYVEWPAAAVGEGPLTLCIAGRNPFGNALEETVRGERIAGRPITTRVILEPEPGCHAMFVAQGAATQAYLRASQGMPVLTVGEVSDFIAQGGIINLLLDGANVRFEIDQQGAERAGLRISSRLLRLARSPGAGGPS